MSVSPIRSKPSYDIYEARMAKVFIGISGLIGAGKSTLAERLAKRLGLPVHYEPVSDNAYLADFYEDMAKHAFPMQVYLLNKRFAQQQQIIWSGAGGVQDRTIYEDSVFARMLRDADLMSERDYETYVDLFNHMSNFMRKPNIIVHLDVKPEESLRRIKLRGRECEAGITLEYLTDLYEAYEAFINDIARLIPVIRVDYSRFPTIEEMVEKICAEYAEIGNVRNVTFSPVPSSPVAEDEAAPAGSAAGAGADPKETTVVTPDAGSPGAPGRVSPPKLPEMEPTATATATALE